MDLEHVREILPSPESRGTLPDCLQSENFDRRGAAIAIRLLDNVLVQRVLCLSVNSVLDFSHSLSRVAPMSRKILNQLDFVRLCSSL